MSRKGPVVSTEIRQLRLQSLRLPSGLTLPLDRSNSFNSPTFDKLQDEQERMYHEPSHGMCWHIESWGSALGEVRSHYRYTVLRRMGLLGV